MDGSGSIEYSRNGKKTLSEAQIQVIFKAMESECQILALASVQLHRKSVKCDMEWADVCKGVALIIKTTPEDDFFLLVVESLLWELHLKESMSSLLTYESRGPYFHCFEKNECTVGLRFDDHKESIFFHRTVEHCLSVLEQINPLFERQVRDSMLERQFRSKPTPPLPTPDVIDKQPPSKWNFRKERKKSKLEIGLPQDFVHRVHIGHERIGGHVKKPGGSTNTNRAHSEPPKCSREFSSYYKETLIFENEASQPKEVALRQRPSGPLLQTTEQIYFPISSRGCESVYDEKHKSLPEENVVLRSRTKVSTVKETQPVSISSSTQRSERAHGAPKLLLGNKFTSSVSEVSSQPPSKPFMTPSYGTILSDPLFSEGMSTEFEPTQYAFPEILKRPSQERSYKQEHLVRSDSGANTYKRDDDRIHDGVSMIRQLIPKPSNPSKNDIFVNQRQFGLGNLLKIEQRIPISKTENTNLEFRSCSQDKIFNSDFKEEFFQSKKFENTTDHGEDELNAIPFSPAKRFQNHLMTKPSPMAAVIRELGNRLIIQDESRSNEERIPEQEHEYRDIRR